MERDRQNDPYTPGKAPDTDAGLDYRMILRYAVAGIGAILILTGLILTVSVFGVIRSIIESPETFVASLDEWSRDEPTETLTPVTSLPVEPETPSPTEETDKADAGREENEPQAVPDAETESEPRSAGPPVFGPNRSIPNRPLPRGPAETSMNTHKFFDDIINFINGDGFGRITGAIIILIFTAFLVHIPVLLIRIGVKLLTTAAKLKISAHDLK